MHSIEHSSLCKMFLTQQQGRKGTSLCEVHSRAQGCDEDIDPHPLSDGGWTLTEDKAATC